MIFIIGPMFSGKKQVAMELLGCSEAELRRRAVWDAEEQAVGCPDLAALADELSAHPVVIANETGCGVVPMDPQQRAAREAAGRLCCLLAQRAEAVVRVFCGIATVIQGRL